MKKLLILLLSIVISSCVDPQDLDFSLSIFCAESPKIKGKDGLFYLPNEELPYSGDNICIYKGSGGYAIQGEIKNGVKYGVETSWYKNGQIMKKGNFIDGKEEGNWTVWYENGQKTANGNFIDGKENGRMTSWYENGQKWGEGNFIDGKEEGNWTEWYENGQKTANGNFIDGKEDGKMTSWNEDGTISSEVIYKDGECISGDCSLVE